MKLHRVKRVRKLTWNSVAEGSSRIVLGGVMTKIKIRNKGRSYKLGT